MQSQDFFSLSSAIIELIQKAAPLIGLALIFALYLWSWRRTGSAFFILQRFWGLLGGNKELSDPNLSEAWKNVKDFYSMRLRTGIKFKSKEHLEHALVWFKENKIGLEEIMPIRSYFDVNNLEIRDPKLKTKKKENWFLSIVLLLAIGPLIILGIPDRAFLIVKSTDTWFIANKGIAHSWNPFAWSITSDDCNKDTPELSEHDKKVICELITSEDSAYIEKTIFQQRAFGVFMGTFSGFLIISLIIAWSKAKTAHDLRLRIMTKKPEQLLLFP